MAYPLSFPNIQYGTGGDISLYALLRQFLNAPIGIYTNDEFKTWLDRGAAIIMGLSKCGEVAQTYITLADATRDYNYPAAMFSAPDDYVVGIDRIFYCGQIASTPQKSVAGYGLVHVNPRLWGHLDANTPGAPLYWTEINTDPATRQIALWPVPTADQANFVCELFFFRVKGVLKEADTGTTQYLPEWMRELPLFYAMAEAYRKYRRYDLCGIYEQIFQKFLMFYRTDRNPDSIDSLEDLKLPDNTRILR